MEMIELESTALIESVGLILSTLAVAFSVLVPYNPFKSKKNSSKEKLTSKKA